MTTDVEDLLRESLHERADRVTPAGLRHPTFEPDVRRGGPLARRRVVVPVASGVAVAAAVAVGVALLPGPGQPPAHRTVPAGRTGSPAPGPSATATHVPGSRIVTHLAAPVTAAGTGTRTVRLGPPPAGANAVEYGFACLSAGRFWFGPHGTDGPGETCRAADVGGQSRHPTKGTLSLKAVRNGLDVTATKGARWRLTATYSKITISPWGVNAHGQTYGVANRHGTPDLVAAMATNGRSGYLRKGDTSHLMPHTVTQVRNQQRYLGTNGSAVVPVYAADGTTVLGVFVIGGQTMTVNGRSATSPPSLDELRDGDVSVTPKPKDDIASTSCPDRNGIGFRQDPPADVHGAESPLAAARRLHQRFGITGYGTADSSWLVTAQSSTVATVEAGAITLHARHQPDGSWVIVSGQHCR